VPFYRLNKSLNRRTTNLLLKEKSNRIASRPVEMFIVPTIGLSVNSYSREVEKNEIAYSFKVLQLLQISYS